MRAVEETTFATHDGVELFYRYWPAVSGAAKGAILLFHRGHEHSGRMAHLADEFDLPDFAVFAWDARGHGHSAAALASEASGQRGDSEVRAHSASEDARERADDTRPEPGSSARAAARSLPVAGRRTL